jgi:hypothetical protein
MRVIAVSTNRHVFAWLLRGWPSALGMRLVPFELVNVVVFAIVPGVALR